MVFFPPSRRQRASKEEFARRFLPLDMTERYDSVDTAGPAVPGAEQKRRTSVPRGNRAETRQSHADSQSTFSGNPRRRLSQAQNAPPSGPEQREAGDIGKTECDEGRKNVLTEMLKDIDARGDRGPLQERLHRQFVRDCVECFTFHDVDNDGLVPIEELPWMLRNLGQFWTVEDLSKMETRFRLQGISQVDVTQFIDLVTEEKDRRKLNVGKLAEAFHVMDRLKKNSVALSDLKQYMTVFGERMNDDDWKTLLKITIGVKEGYKAVAIKQPAFLEVFAKSVEDSI